MLTLHHLKGKKQLSGKGYMQINNALLAKENTSQLVEANMGIVIVIALRTDGGFKLIAQDCESPRASGLPVGN